MIDSGDSVVINDYTRKNDWLDLWQLCPIPMNRGLPLWITAQPAYLTLNNFFRRFWWCRLPRELRALPKEKAPALAEA